MNKSIFTILLILFSMLSCRHSHTHDHDHDHDHDEVKLLITVYDDNFEVFAEADPLVQGQTSSFLLHLTHLESFKPLEAGEVTLSLIIGSRGIRQIRQAPDKAGIYRFALQPEVAGRGTLVIEIESQEGSFRLEAPGISVFEDAHAAIHAAEDMYPEHPGAVSFTKEQSWMVSFATAQVQKQDLGQVIKTVGEVIPSWNDELTLTAHTHGIVNLLDNPLYEGLEVRAGQTLFHVSGAGLAEGNAVQRYQQARNNFQRAKADYERISGLAQEQIVSERELLLARNDYENARVHFEQLSENFSESGQRVHSPVDGYVKQLMVQNGQYVEAGQAVATIIQNRELVIRAEVQQRYAGLLPRVHTANITTPEGNTYSLQELDGRILAMARSTHAGTHLLPLHLAVGNQQNWIPGSLLDVYLKTREEQPLIAVPNTALIEEQGNFFVFVQLHPESFEKREVQVGISDGIYTEIKRGLQQAERIVSKGAIMVKMAAASGDIDPHSGHVH